MLSVFQVIVFLNLNLNLNLSLNHTKGPSRSAVAGNSSIFLPTTNLYEPRDQNSISLSKYVGKREKGSQLAKSSHLSVGYFLPIGYILM